MQCIYYKVAVFKKKKKIGIHLVHCGTACTISQDRPHRSGVEEVFVFLVYLLCGMM